MVERVKRRVDSTKWKVAIAVGIVLLWAAIIGAAFSGGNGGKKGTASKAAPVTTTAPRTTTAVTTTQTTTPVTTSQKETITGKPQGDPDVDKHTRAYIAQVQTCQVEVGLLLLEIRKGTTSAVKLADGATTARDACNTIRQNLLTMSTDHFDDQAATAWYGVDRTKSGLNAFLAYLDSRAPSKLIEARNKLQEGDRDMAQGIKAINVRRRVYGLQPVR